MMFARLSPGNYLIQYPTSTGMPLYCIYTLYALAVIHIIMCACICICICIYIYIYTHICVLMYVNITNRNYITGAPEHSGQTVPFQVDGHSGGQEVTEYLIRI